MVLRRPVELALITGQSPWRSVSVIRTKLPIRNSRLDPG
jgi:hypothetical protein